jgi:hypothetical protein
MEFEKLFGTPSKSVDYILLAHDDIQRRTLQNAIMDLQIP